MVHTCECGCYWRILACFGLVVACEMISIWCRVLGVEGGGQKASHFSHQTDV